MLAALAILCDGIVVEDLKRFRVMCTDVPAGALVLGDDAGPWRAGIWLLPRRASSISWSSSGPPRAGGDDKKGVGLREVGHEIGRARGKEVVSWRSVSRR